MDGPIEILLYGKPDCCLCDEAKAVLRRVAGGYPTAIREVNIASDPGLQVRFGAEVPVVFVDGRKAFKFHLPERDLRRRLERALAERGARRQEGTR